MACQHEEEEEETMSDYFDRLKSIGVEVSPDEDTYQQYSLCRPKMKMRQENMKDTLSRYPVEDPGYSTFDDPISSFNPTNITDHCSYHGVMSRTETNALLLLAPKRGYIIRYSENQDKYILSIACPFSKTDNKVHHFIIAIDNEVPSFGLKGGGRSFPSLEQLLEFYETNWVTPQLESIGNSYTQMETTLWLKEHEMRKKKEEEERKKKEEEEKKKRKEEERKKKEEEERKKKEEEKEEAKEKSLQWQDEKLDIHSEQHKLEPHQEQLLQMQADMTKQQMLFQQQMKDLKKDVMEPLVSQQKEHQQQILELQKANNELLQAIQKRDQRHHHKCCIQ